MALAAAAVILAACGSYGDGGAAAVEDRHLGSPWAGLEFF